MRGCLGTFILLQPDLDLGWIFSSKDLVLWVWVGLYFTDYVAKMIGFGVYFFLDTNSLVKAKAKEYIFH